MWQKYIYFQPYQKKPDFLAPILFTTFIFFADSKFNIFDYFCSIIIKTIKIIFAHIMIKLKYKTNIKQFKHIK